jgi:hypothetical protein
VSLSPYLRLSGQFILVVGTFCAVIVSFVAAVMILGTGARFVLVILLFLAFFAILFAPLTLLTKPLIERDSIRKYLDVLEKKVQAKTFGTGDLEKLKKLKESVLKKRNRRSLTMLPRLTLLLSEMEKIESARAAFFWDEHEGTVH